MSSHEIAVLIVDDDLPQAEGLARWLRLKEKVAADTAPSGDKALAILRSDPQKYDVVILDQIFPDGMSGIEILQQIKAELPGIFVVMFTHDEGEAGLEALRHGAYRYLLKPINNQELGFLIKHVGEIQGKFQEMERRLTEESRLIEAMRDISQKLASVPTGLLLQQIADAGRSLLNVPVCIVWEQDRTDGRFKVKAWSGAVDEAYRQTVSIDGRSQATRQFLNQRKPLALIDIQHAHWYEHKVEAKSRNWISALTVPIAAQERVFGILDVYTHATREFVSWEKQLLSTFAAQAALTIRQSTLMSHARTISLLAATGSYHELADEVVEAVSDVTGTAVSLWMIERPDQGDPVLKIQTGRGLLGDYRQRAALSLNPDCSVVAASLHHKKPISYRDIFDPNNKPQFHYLAEASEQGWRSFLSVPLLGQGQQPIGALSIYGSEVRDFSQDELGLLITFANQASLAFENSQRHRSLAALVESGRIASEEVSDESAVLKRFAELARTLTGAPCVAIYPYDPERGAFYDRSRVVTLGARQEEKSVSDTPREKGLAAIIRNVGRVVVHDLSHDDIEDVDYEEAGEPLDRCKLIEIVHHEGKPGFAEREGINAFIGVSLKAVEDIGSEKKLADVGVMYINFREPHHFTSAELSLIQLFAQQVANLIRAARLRGSLQEQLRLSEILVRASGEIEQANSQDEILRKVFQRSFDLIGQATGLVIAVESNRSLRIIDSLGVSEDQRDTFHRLSPSEDMGSLGHVIRTRELFECPNTDGALKAGSMRDLGLPIPRSVTNVPILSQGKVVSILVLDTIAPDDRVRNAMLALAKVAEIAIEKTQRTQMLSDLNRVGDSLTEVIDLATVLLKVVSEAQAIMEADAVTLYEYDRQKKYVKVPPTHIGLHSAETYFGPKTFGGNSVAQRIALLGQTYYAVDAENDPLTNAARPAGATPSFVAREGIKSAVGIPLQMAGETVGVLFGNYRRPHEFTDLEKEKIALFANQAAVAIQNALRLEQEQISRREADTLRDIGKSISSTLDLELAANTILDEMKKVIEYRKATIQLIGEDGDSRLLAAYRGFGRECVDPILLRPLSQDPLIREIAEKKQPRILNRTRDSHGWGDNPNTANVRSWACAPLVSGGKTIGLLTLDHDQEGFYVDKTVDLLLLYASQAAAAIQNARLFQEQQERNKARALLQQITSDISAELDTKSTLPKLLEGAMRLSGTTSGIIRLVDKDKATIIQEYEFPEAFGHTGSRFQDRKGMTWKIVYTGNPVFVSDINNTDQDVNSDLREKGIRAYIGLPLKFGNATVGALFLNDTKLHNFLTREIELLTLLASNAAIAIQKAQLVQDLSERVKDLDALTWISQGLNSPEPMTVHAMAQELWEAARHLMDLSYFYVASYDESQDRVDFEFVVEQGEEIKERTGEWTSRVGGHGLTEHVIMKRELIYLTPDVGQARRELDAHEGLRDGVTWEEWEVSQEPTIVGYSWLGVPIIVGQDVLGVIGVQNYDQPYAYDEFDQQVLTTVAAQLAIAIVRRELEVKNGQLHQVVSLIKRRNHELEALTEIGRMVSNLGIDQILDLIYAEMAKILDLSNAQIQFAFYEESRNEVTFPLAIEQDNGHIIDVIRWSKRNALYRTEGEDEIVDAYRPRPRDPEIRFGLTEYVISTRRPIFIPSNFWEAANALRAGKQKVRVLPTFGRLARPTYSWLGVPMIVQGRVIGIISIQSLEQERAFDQAQVDLLTIVASQAAVAIENARLLEDTAWAKQLTTLQEIGIEITSQRNPKQVIETIVEKTNEITGADFCTLFPYDAGRDRFLDGVRKGKVDKAPSVPTNDGFSAGLVKTQGIVFVEDTAKHNGPLPTFVQTRNVKAFAAIPLIFGDTTVGLLYVNFLEPHPFLSLERRLIDLLARQAAVAIINARSYGEIEDELRISRERITRAEQAILAESFTMDILHRVPNLVGPILMRAETAIGKVRKKETLDVGDKAVISQLEGIQRDGEAMLRSVRQWNPLEESTQKELSNVGILLNSALRNAFMPENVVLEIDLGDDDLPGVECNAKQLFESFRCIIENASQAMQARGGKLTVRAAARYLDGNPLVFVTIADTGPGIDPNILPRIFDSFFTTKDYGSGYGLWRARSVIVAIGGTIDVKSEAGRGTEFTIVLPGVVGTHGCLSK